MNQRKPFPPQRASPSPEMPHLVSEPEGISRKLKRSLLRFRKFLYLGVVIIILFIAFLIYDAVQSPTQHLTQSDIDKAVGRTLEKRPLAPSLSSQAYQKIEPSLVSIEVQFTQKDGKDETGVGSGFVVSEDGTIMTCLHVVNKSSAIKVIFADGFETTATIKDRQWSNDIALLRPDVVPADLVPAVLAGSRSLKTGDEVYAVGSPFGIEKSLTAGVVSGLKRSFQSPEAGMLLSNLIQFDAAVNPGNSGGPLMNRAGEVVGVVTAILNPTDQRVFIGIGFATTIENAANRGGPPPV